MLLYQSIKGKTEDWCIDKVSELYITCILSFLPVPVLSAKECRREKAGPCRDG